MRSALTNSILTVVIIVFVVIFTIGLYEIMSNYLHDKYQSLYRNNNQWYWPMRFRLRKKCLNGCRLDKTCPRGSLCYNCKGPNPTCCCYDSQCQGCGE